MNKKKQVFITGVSQGLGRALADQFLEQGWLVFGCSRSRPDALTSEKNFQFAEIDLSSDCAPSACREFLTSIGGCDLAILNAGVFGEVKPLKETKVQQMKDVVEVNLWANKWLMDLLLSPPNNVGQIIAMSSGASVTPMKGWGGYSISKAALNMLIGLYAMDYPQTHFSALAPGLVDTAMQTYLTGLPDEDQYESVVRLKEAKEKGKILGPSKVASDIFRFLGEFKKYPSGSFIDIRRM